MGNYVGANVHFGIDLTSFVGKGKIFSIEQIKNDEIPVSITKISEQQEIIIDHTYNEDSEEYTILMYSKKWGGGADFGARNYGSSSDSFSLPTEKEIVDMTKSLNVVLKKITSHYRVRKPKLNIGLVLTVEFG